MLENVLHLPQLDIEYPEKVTEEKLLVLGGRAPDVSWLAEAAFGRELWCVDGGADVCLAAQLIPARLVGDGDSATAAAWEWAAQRAKQTDRYDADKSLTDTQLALKLLPRTSLAVLTGAFGGRFDHAYSTLFSCARQKPYCCLADEQEAIFLLRKGVGEMKFTFREKPQNISLLPLSRICTGVTITGVKWPLEGASLEQTNPYAVSNRLSGGNYTRVACATGLLAVYFEW